jgi:hypothetical protein
VSTEFVKVPFKREADGTKTFFLPACRTAGGYRIGPKGDERTVSDYWQAVEQLSAMQPPRFRRQNAEGNFGIVKCEPESFEDVSRAFLEDEVGKHRG